MVEKGAQQFLQAAHLRRAPVDQRVHVERKARLKVRQAEQRLHQHRRIDGARARLQHQADVLGGFVAHVGQQRNLLRGDQFGQPLDQFRLLHLIGDLGDDDLIDAAPHVLDHPLRAQTKAAAPRGVGLRHRLGRVDQHAAGGKIRARHDVGQRRIADCRIVEHPQQRAAEFPGVVRRDRGRHADRDAAGAVGQQVGEGAGQDHRLLLGAVVGGAQIDRVLVQPLQHRLRDGGHPRFGVALGGGVVAVDVAEIALPVDQRIAQRKVLRRAHQRVIDAEFAMRVILADHVADHARRFLEPRPRVEPQLPHRIKHAAVHRLQPVARVGQRAVHDCRERILKIALAQGAAQRFARH